MKFSNYLECQWVIVYLTTDAILKWKLILVTAGVNNEFSAVLTSSLPIFTDLIP